MRHVEATLNLASALDPRFKSLLFLSDEEKQETVSRLVAEDWTSTLVPTGTTPLGTIKQCLNMAYAFFSEVINFKTNSV